MVNGVVYVFTRLPFGDKTTVAPFARALRMILGRKILEFTIYYLDDFLVISLDIEQHIDHLDQLLERLGQAEFTVNFKKCQFFQQKINLLGHELTAKGIGVNPALSNKSSTIPFLIICDN